MKITGAIISVNAARIVDIKFAVLVTGRLWKNTVLRFEWTKRKTKSAVAVGTIRVKKSGIARYSPARRNSLHGSVAQCENSGFTLLRIGSAVMRKRAIA